MPNWCMGDLKIRGTEDNLRKFIKEGLSPVGFIGDSMGLVKYCDNYGVFTAKLSEERAIFHINNTRRHFIDSDEIEVWFEDDDNREQVIVLEDFKAAWGIDAGQLAEVSKKFNIDFKILGFEMGMEFNQDIEVIKGEIIKNKEIEFDNYQWECIRPRMGG